MAEDVAEELSKGCPGVSEGCPGVSGGCPRGVRGEVRGGSVREYPGVSKGCPRGVPGVHFFQGVSQGFTFKHWVADSVQGVSKGYPYVTARRVHVSDQNPFIKVVLLDFTLFLSTHD